MKCSTVFLFFAALAVTSVQATLTSSSTTTATGGLRQQQQPQRLRGLQTREGPEMVDFAAATQLASFNGIHAGEEILAAVNDALTDAKKIDGDQLLAIATRLAAKDATLLTADAYTLKVVSAVRVAFGKLFPGEAEDDVLRRVLPKIPHPAAVRRLEETAPLESIDFSDAHQVASFNGVHAGEEILAQVNKITPNVDGNMLLDVARKVASGDASSLATADAKTKQIEAAFKQVVAQLFPGESFGDVLQRLLPLIPRY